MQLKAMLKNAKRIVFFGGAGVSTESGIPDFRSPDGLYHQKYRFPPETIISRSFFEKYPEEFYRFYKEKMLFPNALPNACHLALARLEKTQKDVSVVTQNIDGLHTKAGSQRVFELHGSVHRNYCTRCKKFYPLSFVINSQGIPKCACGGTVKPDVVLYEEPLDQKTVQNAVNAIQNADLLIIAGTSLSVYPAAGFIDYFNGEHIALINKTPTPADEKADLVIHDAVGKIMEQAVNGL